MNQYEIGGTVTVTPAYAAVDGRPANPEPLDGYVGADTGGVYFCASGDFAPGGTNNPATSLSEDCMPQPPI